MSSCTTIIKAGVNAGKQCSGTAVEGTDKCARHTPRDPEANKNRTVCTALIKNGDNAGKQCTAFAREGTTLCGRHSPRVPAAKKDGPICTALVKNGVNAGKQCTALALEGTTLCGRHSPREPKKEGDAAAAPKKDVKKLNKRRSKKDASPKKDDDTSAPKKKTTKKPAAKKDGPICTALVKNGVNAGKQCTALAREGTTLCGRHSPREPKKEGDAAAAPKKPVTKKDGPLCTALIKNGENAGKPCTTVAREGTSFCGRHTPREPKKDGDAAAAPKKEEAPKKN